MQTIIDLDLREVVSDFTVKSPAPPYAGKSQDTQSHEVYFVQGGAVQDLGTGPAIKYGLIGPAGPSLLVLCTSYTRQVDVNGNVFYLGFPIFNTSNLASALGTSTSIACISEVRYQLSSGEIEHTLDIPITIFRTILSEITSDVTTAAFTAPAVGANVTIAIGSTTWLQIGQQLTIATAGIYQVISITDATHFVAQNTGQPGNAISGTVIASGSAVAGAPVNALTTYPPSNTLELISTRDVASGHAGLTAAKLLNPTVIPVDNVTVQILDGQIASSFILAETAASFVTPAANATVNVNLVSSTGLVVGQYVRLPIAGYYIVQSIPDGTHAVLQNNGDPFNVASGVTVPTDTPLLPAQAAAGGGSGTPGQNAYTLTTASFTVPAVGATVSVALVSTAWLGGNGYYVFITGAGYYAVGSITDGTHAVLTNAGGTSNAPPGTVVPTNTQVAASGLPGPTGASGAGLAAYDALAVSFIQPAVTGTVTITIGNTAWISANQIIYIATGGYYQVSAISSATQALVINLNYPGNATATTVIASGSRVSPGGLQGPQGAGGAGLNAFTTLSANFTQPIIGATVTVNVGSTSWMAGGQGIFIQGGGYYTISSISDSTHAVVTNLGGPSNPAAGSTITGSGTQNVTPAGIPGTNGINAYTTTTASFVAPASGSSVTMTVGNTSWATNGQTFFIAGAGYYQVAAILSATQFSITNLGYTGNAAGGTTVGSGASVSTSGPIGPAGSPGPTGAAGRDGAYSTVYSAQSIQGNGGAASNLTLVGDIAQATGAYKVYQRDSGGNSKWDVALLSGADAISTAGAGEVSQIASQTSGVLSLKKLKSGPAGSVALTDQGGSTGDILVDVPVDGTTIQVVSNKLTATGAGAAPFDPRNGFYFYEDFLWSGGGTGTGLPPEWAFDAGGTGAYLTLDSAHSTSAEKAQGLIQLSTQVASGAHQGGTLRRGFVQSANYNSVTLGGGPFDMAARVAISTPTTGVGYRMSFGLWLQTGTGNIYANTPINSLLLDYSPDNNSNKPRILYNTASGAVTPVNCTGGTPPTSSPLFIWWELKVDASGNITALANGSVIGTAGPISGLLGVPLVPVFGIDRTSGTTNYLVAIDCLYIYQPYTR